MAGGAPFRHWIAGNAVEADASRWSLKVRPGDRREVLGEVPLDDVAGAQQAVQAARDAQPQWASLPGPARAQALNQWASAIEARTDELASVLSTEVGKPITEAKGEVGRCSMILRYFAGEAVREAGVVIPAQSPNALQYTVHDPLGVVAAITPWNFPLAIPLWKAAPALAFGNAVVLKVSELSPRTGELLAETSRVLPSGVFNVVQGDGAVGAALCNDEQVAAVTFTGSAAAGHKVAMACVARNAKFQCEMGGKNVAIVLDDANLDLAASLIAAGAMRYAGQKCTATSRVVIQDRVYDDVMARLQAAIDALPIGPESDPACAVGPLIDERAFQRVEGILAGAAREPMTGPLAYGFYVRPYVFSEVALDAPVAREEIFGPVLAAFRVASDDEALAIANDTPYGLSASVLTTSVTRAMPFVRGLQAGMVRVNGDTTGVDPHAPFGGLKGSSSHSREQGPAARDFFTEIRTIQINA
ncbi:MAG: aldehyde dehydrogenase family protein [Fimbriimonadaceae bacterium]